MNSIVSNDLPLNTTTRGQIKMQWTSLQVKKGKNNPVYSMSILYKWKIKFEMLKMQVRLSTKLENSVRNID